MILNLSRAYLSAGLATIGQSIPARSTPHTSTGGMYMDQFTVPPDWPANSTFTITLLHQIVTNSSQVGATVVYEIAMTKVQNGVAAANVTENNIVPVPDNWQTTQPQFFQLDSPASLLVSPGDAVGLRIARLGADANDTLTENVLLSEACEVATP